MQPTDGEDISKDVHNVNLNLKESCKKPTMEFSSLFKPELGCLKDFELEVKFKKDAKPVFCKPRPVVVPILDSRSQSYVYVETTLFQSTLN